MKNLEQKEGFSNRHIDSLPDKTTIMRVVQKDADGEYIHLCEWQPFDKNQYSQDTMPSEGYLGTAKVIEGKCKDIGFNVWQQNNSEFVWYDIVHVNNFSIKMYNIIKKFFGLRKNESKVVVLNKPNVVEDSKKATKKLTKFRQSLEFNEVDQFYYDQARQLMKDNGFASMGHFIRDELPTIPEEALKITKERFAEILIIAQNDYYTLMFDPHGLKSGF